MRQYKEFVKGMTRKEIVFNNYINLDLKYGEELWKYLDETHQVSNYSRIRRVYKNGKTKLLIPNINSSWYMGITIKGRTHNTAVYGMKVWGREPVGLEHVHHINGNPYDNHISNLECLTPKEHYHIHKDTRTWSKGARKVELIDKRRNKVIKKFDSIQKAKHWFGVSSSAIDRYINDGMPSKEYTFRYAD